MPFCFEQGDPDSLRGTDGRGGTGPAMHEQRRTRMDRAGGKVAEHSPAVPASQRPAHPLRPVRAAGGRRRGDSDLPAEEAKGLKSSTTGRYARQLTRRRPGQPIDINPVCASACDKRSRRIYERKLPARTGRQNRFSYPLCTLGFAGGQRAGACRCIRGGASIIASALRVSVPPAQGRWRRIAGPGSLWLPVSVPRGHARR